MKNLELFFNEELGLNIEDFSEIEIIKILCDYFLLFKDYNVLSYLEGFGYFNN